MPRKHTSKKHEPYQLKRSCDDKRAYKSESDAEQAAELRMLENMSIEISVYKCSQCSDWHLTRQQGR